MKGYSSPIIENFINEMCNNREKAIEKFWSLIEKRGTPLVDKIEGDENNVLITFIYRGQERLDSVMVYGGVPGFEYKQNVLNKIENTDIWTKTYKVRNDVKFKYRFCLNYKENFEFKDIKKNSIIDPLNSKTYVYKKDDGDPEDEDGIESFVKLENVEEDYWTSHEEAKQKGTLEVNSFTSNILENTRRVWIYKPFGYSPSKEYNLILLLDGGLYINNLCAINTIDNLIEEKKINESVCVFIDNIQDRYNELTCNDNFCKFIVDEIMPWINNNYMVTKNPSKIIIGGLSLGGLAVAYLGFKYSNIFGNVLAQSGSFWFEKGALIEKFKEVDKLPLRFYLNVGLLEDRPYDNEPVMADYINPFRDLLNTKGYEVDYETFQSGHDFLSWGETLAYGLIALST